MDRFEELHEAAKLKPHGTRARYMAGCKCLLCRAANSRYETERFRARRNGDWNGIVPAARARKHLIKLSKQQVGRRSVSEVTGISETILQHIKQGKRRNIRARTERLILNIDRHALSAAAIIPAGPTWKKINWLLDEGFTKKELAKRLGYRTPAIQFRKDRITVKTAVKVERFYESMQR
jgi:hypothetical protein